MVVTVVPSETISTEPAFESSLLLTLEEISRLVSHSHHPGETLANIVRLIQGRFHTDVCSVYLLEPEKGQLVLGATIGLKPESVGRVRMRIDEGLSGLVAEKLAPVMVEDAFEHPRFKFFPEAGEDPYHSFLGVPLIEGGVLQGVLVVQTREPRTFSLNEVRLLVTVAAQLAPLVSEALLLEQVVAATHEDSRLPASSPCGPISRRGIALSPGVGVGQAYVINGFEEWQRSAHPRTTELGQEQSRLADAMDAARDELQRLSQRISALVGEEHGAILQGQLMIMQDGTIEDDLRACLSSGATAESALLETLDKYAAAFRKLTNPYFQERVYDIKDVFRRVLWHLRPRASGEEPGCERLVLVSRDVSVMDLFSVDLDRLAAVVAEQGGPQSHAAILARSLGIPMVAQVPEVIREVRSGRLLRVDGSQGEVCLDPLPTALACESPTAPLPSPSRFDGASEYSPATGLPRIEANINLISEVARAVQHGASGVGLYRSEFLFLARRTLATEDEQVEIYRKLLEGLDGRPATIRTYDFRPDKVNQVQTPGFSGHRLDWRRVLDSPPLQKLFKDQVRAIMRAAAAGPARILVPLVTRSEQLDFVVDAVGRARDELRREGWHHAADVPLGVMIEVAAAIPLVESWTPTVDFFALGTNDLVASALGISRDDPVELASGDPLHPGFLRIVSQVIDAAHRANRPVTVCGEMASDPDATIALSALGVNSLSVAVHRLAIVRQTLGGIAPHALPELSEELPHLRTAAEVRNFVQKEVIRY
jgi:phosphotransferase system enzyme I (PtsP)